MNRMSMRDLFDLKFDEGLKKRLVSFHREY